MPPKPSSHRVIHLFRTSLLAALVLTVPLGIFLRMQLARFDGNERLSTHYFSAQDVWSRFGSSHFSAEEYMRAERLAGRLEARNMAVPPTETLARVLAERDTFMQRSVEVTMQDGEHAPYVLRISLAAYPEWLRLQTSALGASWSFSTDAVHATIETIAASTNGLGFNPTVKSVAMIKGVPRAVTDGVARAGYMPDMAELTDRVIAALRDNVSSVTMQVPYAEATIAYPGSGSEDGEEMKLTLLASGRSDFAGSPENRIFNLTKAFTEHINNVVIPAGEVFSFNSALDVPVTFDKGWKEALGLFGGGAAMTPGGGICQASTTVYRAALLTGLPIVQRRWHSLYVSYYEKYGVGIDSTIFPGVHDLQFKNDTGHDIVLQAIVNGTGAMVNVYGVDDGRTVELEGPFFASTPDKPAELQGMLSWKDIGWVQTVRYPDGRTVRDTIFSRYAKGIPSSVARNNPPTLIVNEGKAAEVAQGQ